MPGLSPPPSHWGFGHWNQHSSPNRSTPLLQLPASLYRFLAPGRTIRIPLPHPAHLAWAGSTVSRFAFRSLRTAASPLSPPAVSIGSSQLTLEAPILLH